VAGAPEVMKATDFEYRHRTLLHLLVVGLAVATYFVSRDDIVWSLVRDHSNNRFLEQVAFGVGTLMLIGCAVLETWANAYVQPVVLLLSRLLFALVVGLLVPIAGTIVIVGGDAEGQSRRNR
jgi:MFS family permease